jgi:hypothetical protein
MSKLHNQTVFNFCAIPQVMAIATLALCYNNPHLFSSVLKIRKGQAVSLMLEATNMPALYSIFRCFVRQISLSIPDNDPSAQATRVAIQRIESQLQAAAIAGILQDDNTTFVAPLLFGVAIGVALGYNLRPLLGPK